MLTSWDVGAPLVQVDGKVFVNLQQGKLNIEGCMCDVMLETDRCDRDVDGAGYDAIWIVGRKCSWNIRQSKVWTEERS